MRKSPLAAPNKPLHLINEQKNSLLNDDVEQRILFVRGQKVTLGQHLAELYGVSVKALNQSVSRNRDHFPIISRRTSCFSLSIKNLRT